MVYVPVSGDNSQWLLSRCLTCQAGITFKVETSLEDKLHERRNGTHRRSGGLVGAKLVRALGFEAWRKRDSIEGF